MQYFSQGTIAGGDNHRSNPWPTLSRVFGAAGLKNSAWRYMFEGIDINPKHVFKEFFHGDLYAASINNAKKLYLLHVFQAIFYEPDHKIGLSMPIKR
jgi:hypothetical protein